MRAVSLMQRKTGAALNDKARAGTEGPLRSRRRRVQPTCLHLPSLKPRVPLVSGCLSGAEAPACGGI